MSVVTVVAALLAECEKLSPPRAAPLSADIHEEPIASHHVRLALFPLRLDADRTGYVNIGLLRRRMLVVDDVHVIHMRLLDPSLRRILGQARSSP